MKPFSKLPRPDFLPAVILACLAAQGPTVQAEPLVPGFQVSTYAQMLSPVRMSFDAGGAMFVGNGSNDLAGAPIFRVAPGGGTVSAYGPAIFDADTVLVDRTGALSGVVGAVLVGGSSGLSAPAGTITAVRPDQTAFALIGPSTVLANPADLVVDQTGRLLISDNASGDPAKKAVFVADGGTLTRLFVEGAGATPDSMTISPSNQIVTSGSDGVLRIHSATGSVVNDAFVTGLSAFPLVESSPGGAWGTDLIALDPLGGTLLRINPLGQTTVIGTGFAADSIDLAFGPDGALYVAQFTGNAILRIAPVPEPGTWALMGAGVLLIVGRGLRRGHRHPRDASSPAFDPLDHE